MEGEALDDADRFFSAVLKGLRPLLKENGFRHSSQNFVRESAECWAIINLQKSRWSQPGEKTFYVNVAVTAKRLVAFDDDPADKPPPYWKCVWNNRAEQFGPESKIQQWTVRDEQTVAETAEYLKTLIGRFVIPSIIPRMSEAALLHAWSDIHNLGYQQLKAKSVLLAASGKLADLRRTFQALRETYGNGATENGVRSHIEKLRSKFPETMRGIEG